MTSHKKTPSSQDPEAGLSRRELIKRGLALGAAGYVAPMIVGAVTPVRAQGVSGNGCSSVSTSCPDGVVFCGEECLCLDSVDGRTVCAAGVCNDSAPCSTDAECEPGFFCISLLEGCGQECEVDTYCIPSCAIATLVDGRQNRAPWPALSSLR